MSSLAHLPVSGKFTSLSAPDRFFIPRPDASADDAYMVALSLLEQAQSGIALLMAVGGSADGFSVSHNTVYAQLCTLNKLVAQAASALDHDAVGSAA